MGFKLGDDEHVFRHEWQTMENDTVPVILGNDFFAKHKARFDFDSRVIKLTVGSKIIDVPFTVGDEQATEQDKALCSMVDVIVPPHTAYLLPHCRTTAADDRRGSARRKGGWSRHKTTMKKPHCRRSGRH